jgi:DNA-binding CsgD family transcriptional regulator
VAAGAAAQAHQVAATLPGGSPPWSCYATVAEAEMLRQSGRLCEAATMVAVLYDQALVDGSIDAQAYAAWQLAKTALDQGRVATAARYGREAAVLLRQVNRLPALRDCLVVLATAEALRREPGQNPGGGALAQLDALRIEGSIWMAADLLIARAWTAVAAHDFPAARTFLEDAVVVGERIGDRVGQVTALHDLARLGQFKEVAARLALVAEGAEGDLVPAQAAHALAGSRGDAAALERAAASFEALGAWLLAAETAADAAVAWRRALEPRPAAAAERKALNLAERCEGASTPALVAVESRALLTAAERETALLAAAGRSNKEIAEQLLLSQRTVENYLHRVYDKLGVSGRADLAAALEG